MKKNIFIKGLLVIIISVFAFNCSDNDKNTAGNQVYYCPMHPEVVSDKPGVCPICHMDLVLKGSGETMDESDAETVTISSSKQVLANVATVKVKKEKIQRTISAYSYLDFAEQNRRLITARFNGRIEKLFVNNTGDYVKKGTPLFEIYSPELVQAQNEYLITLNNLSGQGSRLLSEGNSRENLLEESAKQKLLLLGLTEEQIKKLSASNKPDLTLTYYSPFAGTVIEKKVQEGMYVNEGSVIYDIADMGTIWSISEIFESDLSAIKEGSNVTLRLNSYPGETFAGKVNLIYPVVNSENRTVKVRSSFINKRNKLKPNMYGETLFQSNLGEGLIVPSEAVLQTGKRNIVWIKIGKNSFIPREVTLGVRFNDSYQVLSGLIEGEEVASTGAYLIDSESQLKGGLSSGTHTDHSEPSVPKSDEGSPMEINDGNKPEKEHNLSENNIWNELCPVLGGKIDTEVTPVKYKGKQVGFCCAGCDSKFKSDPEKYLGNLSSDGKNFIKNKKI